MVSAQNTTAAAQLPYKGERVLKHDPQDVLAYGRCAAFVLAQLRYYSSDKGRRYTRDGWACFTAKQWAAQIPFAPRTIERALHDLSKSGKILKAENLDRNTPGYRMPDTDSKAEQPRQNGEAHPAKAAERIAKTAKRTADMAEHPAKVAEQPCQNGDAHIINVLEEKKEEEETPLPPLGEPAKPKPKAAKPLLAELEAQLSPEVLPTWSLLKQAMQQKRSRAMSENIPAALLADLLESISKHSLSDAQAVYGLKACMKAENGPAENERYFRKAALGYKPEPEYNPRSDYSRPSYSSGPPEGFDYPHIEFDQGGGK